MTEPFDPVIVLLAIMGRTTQKLIGDLPPIHPGLSGKMRQKAPRQSVKAPCQAVRATPKAPITVSTSSVETSRWQTSLMAVPPGTTTP